MEPKPIIFTTCRESVESVKKRQDNHPSVLVVSPCCESKLHVARQAEPTHLRVLIVSPVELSEGKPSGSLDDGLGLAVQPELTVGAVTRSQLLASYREHTAHAIAHEYRVHAGGDEHPDTMPGGVGGMGVVGVGWEWHWGLPTNAHS